MKYAAVCFCGCGAVAVQEHHVVYQQELRHVAQRLARDVPVLAAGVGRRRAPRPFQVKTRELMEDRRNLVPAGLGCHRAHHDRINPYSLRRLPDSVFEFAAEVLGPGPAYEYLRRRYAGRDARLDALVA